MNSGLRHNQFQRFIFLGIGGIGMSALARYLLICGKSVLGFDRSSSEITLELQNRGVQIVHDINPEMQWFAPELAPQTLIVFTPALPLSDLWMIAAKNSEFTMVKRAELLGAISAESNHLLAVAGTHGKTTTSAILAHLLAHANKKGMGLIGGIVQNYQSNLVLSQSQEMALSGGEVPDYCVVEADEFDRSFLALKPKWACITSVDPDHLDIYQDKETFVAAFELFAQTLAPDQLFIAEGLDLRGITVGFSDQAQISAQQVKVLNGRYRFNLRFNQEIWEDLTGPLPGRHNLINVMMAIALARSYGLTQNQVADALLNFKGIQRRFNQYKLAGDRVLIDDYAHHPTELRALLQGVKEFYPDQPHILLFQPHLFSRTRDFARDFAQVFNEFDRVILMPIYPARELPISGVHSDWLASLCAPEKVQSMDTNSALAAFAELESTNSDLNSGLPAVFIVAGAGDIGLQVQSLIKKLSS